MEEGGEAEILRTVRPSLLMRSRVRVFVDVGGGEGNGNGIGNGVDDTIECASAMLFASMSSCCDDEM